MSTAIFGGIDEVGYGALAGPYISVVALFRDKDLKFLPSGVTDSKKLSQQKLETLYEPICAAAYDIGLGHAWPWEIDTLKPRPALQLCYKRAIADLSIAKPTILFTDGNVGVDGWGGKQIIEPKADLKYVWVSAASIIAKVWRDRMMAQLAKRHPKYEWNVNKGYGTHEHEQAILKHGLLVSATNSAEYIHRKHYCKKFLVK